MIRAKIVLFAVDGQPNRAIAQRLDVHVDVVSRWRKRFCTQGMAGLADRARSGRPRTFSAEVVAQVKAMACEPPAQHEVPLSRWSSADLAAQAVVEGVLVACRPRRYGAGWPKTRSSRGGTDRGSSPGTRTSRSRRRSCSTLYQRIWEGAALGEDEYVISADEKSQLQALSRGHPERSPAPGRTRRVEFEYERHGTLAYFGAYDVHRAQLMGSIAPTTGIAPFSELVRQVMTAEPYASAKRVFWVVDNGSSHAGRASIVRMTEAWPTPTLVHLPVHASWLNQIEIVFSVIQRKVITPVDFIDLDALAQRLRAFEPRCNATAKPFDWTFTPTDLAELLRRIDPDQPSAEAVLAA